MKFVPINIATTAVTLFFIMMLIGIYMTKKNAKNFDNKIFRHLLLWNFLSLLLHLIYQSLALDYTNYLLPIEFLVKLYFCCVIYYLELLTIYIIYSTNENNKEFMGFVNSNLNKINTFIYSSYFILLFITLITSSRVDYQEEAIYYYGFAGYFYYIILAVGILVCFATIIKNRGNYDKKKITPLYVILALAVIYTIGGFVYPGICLLTTLFAGYSFLMFHTMANPDMKLISELELAKSSAEKANNAKSDFLSSMSHELRTPLNAIVGLSQMIVENSTDNDSKNDANDILKASNNLLQLVDSILDINKLDSNNMEIVNSNYNPKDVFDDLEKMTKVRIGDKPIELRTRFSNLPESLYGDKDKLKIIINNLISNAVKYTDNGFIDFNVDAVVKEDICNLRITISDTGRGIENDQKEFLFTKFYRLESDKDSDIEGAGLGLAITKSLVDLLEGEITVNSTASVGTIFTVTLTQKIHE